MCPYASLGSLVPGEQMSWQWHEVTWVCHFLGQDTTQGWTPCAAGRCVRWDTAQGTNGAGAAQSSACCRSACAVSQDPTHDSVLLEDKPL